MVGRRSMSSSQNPSNLYWFGLGLTYGHVSTDPGHEPVVVSTPEDMARLLGGTARDYEHLFVAPVVHYVR